MNSPESGDSCPSSSFLANSPEVGASMRCTLGLELLKLTLDVGHLTSVCFQQLFAGELLFFSLSLKKEILQVN